MTFPSNDESPYVAVDAPPTPSKREQRLNKVIAYFSSYRILIKIILTAAFSGVELHFGIDYRNQCPMEPWINIFLIVHGSTKLGWVVLAILAYINAKFVYGYMNKKTMARQIVIPSIVLELLFTLWFLAWFIAGNVWVFSKKSSVQYTNPKNTSTYCNQILYTAAFGLIIGTYIAFSIIITFIIIRRRVINKKTKSHLDPNQDGDHQPIWRF
jgi:hypothetical protein